MTNKSRRPRVLAATLTVFVLSLLGGLVASTSVATTGGQARTGAAASDPLTGPVDEVLNAEADQRPNIVFITTDDQRLADMKWMPHTRRLLGGSGFTFTNGLSPHPLCCPARAEWMTGQYGQNNGVLSNSGPWGGYPALIDPENTIGTWMQDGGYQTAMSGKYLNFYKAKHGQQAGWDHWNPSVEGVYSYINTTFWNDGRLTDRKGVNVDDAIADFAQRHIREFSQNDAPFFVWASHLSPHGASSPRGWVPPIAAERHRDWFPNVRNDAERKPSYGRATDGGDGYGVERHRMDAHTAYKLTRKHIARIRSLQAVDEGVRDIVQTLRQTGELKNTYIIFTSDNGYLLGEHQLTGKNFLYEEALKVPFLVRVPGPDEARVSHTPVTLVDVAPTIADLGNVTPDRVVDGVSFAPLLRDGKQPWRSTQLIQTGANEAGSEDPGWETRGVRTARWTYVRNMFTGAEQLYDRDADPYQMTNLAAKAKYAPVIQDLRNRMQVLQTCAGAACSASFGPEPVARTKR